MQKMRILAIETSCDETAVAIVETGNFRILSNIVSSQVPIHAQWGGVVPSLAKREHEKNAVPVLIEAMQEAKLLKKVATKKIDLKQKEELKKILTREPDLQKIFLRDLLKIKTPNIDAIAVTNGPGLEPALWVGVNFAKALAYLWNKPLIPVNHMEGHLLAWLAKDPLSPRLQRASKSPSSAKASEGTAKIKFPVIGLLVSGGHTEIIFSKKIGQYKIVGQTRDDAAGEAFDKAAKMLGLGYPGGPIVSAMAEKLTPEDFLKLSFRKLPRPMIKSKDYDFSFSGLKTALLYFIRDAKENFSNFSDSSSVNRSKNWENFLKNLTPAICKEYQQAIIDVLIEKTFRAVKEYKAKTIILGGGVVANGELRKQFSAHSMVIDKKVNLILPERKLTTDNAVMIAIAGSYNKPRPPETITANGNLSL